MSGCYPHESLAGFAYAVDLQFRSVPVAHDWRRDKVSETDTLIAERECINNCYAIAKKYTQHAFLRE